MGKDFLAMDKLSQINIFDRLAAHWDEKYPPERDKLDCLVRLCDLQPGACVVDAACGTGSLEPSILEYAPARVLAVDFSPEMIAAARKKLQDPRVEYRCADLMELTENENDCIFLCSAFQHFENKGSLIRHLHYLLRDEGRLMICSPVGRRELNAFCTAHLPELSMPLPQAQTMTNLLQSYFDVDILIDSPAFYAVSGIKRRF